MEYQALIASLPKDVFKVIANPYQNKSTDNSAPLSHDRIICAVGPEGGFSPEEVEFSFQNGFHSQRLGPRILRLETAVVSLLTLTQAHHGDLN